MEIRAAVKEGHINKRKLKGPETCSLKFLLANLPLKGCGSTVILVLLKSWFTPPPGRKHGTLFIKKVLYIAKSDLI